MDDQPSVHQRRHLVHTGVRRVWHVLKRAAEADGGDPLVSTIQRFARQEEFVVRIDIEEP